MARTQAALSPAPGTRNAARTDGKGDGETGPPGDTGTLTTNGQ